MQQSRRSIFGIAAAAAVLAAVAGVIVWATAPEPAEELDPVAVAAGAALYAQHCAACHGANLEGQPNWQERQSDGRLPAPPHNADGHTWHHPDAVLFAVTKHGMSAVAPPGYESDMPAFEGVLSDDEIHAVIAFIKSTWPERIQRQHEAINARAQAQ